MYILTQNEPKQDEISQCKACTIPMDPPYSHQSIQSNPMRTMATRTHQPAKVWPSSGNVSEHEVWRNQTQINLLEPPLSGTGGPQNC